MSYDIRFGVRVAGTDKDVYCVIGEPEYSSPTYNVRDIFVESMGWDYHQSEWYSMDEVMPKIKKGIENLKEHGNDYKHLEPDNGWGSVSSALTALESIYGWFYPTNIWDRKYDEDIPLNCIYMAW